MYLPRFTVYLLAIALTSLAGNFVIRVTAKSEDNFPTVQQPATESLKEQVPEVKAPSVNFPESIFPEVKFSEIAFSEIRVQENQYLAIITLPTDVLFDSGKDKIRPDAEKALLQVSQAISNRYPDTWLQILGHTDSNGDEDYNLKLSEQQVTAVQQWLSEKGGIDSSLMMKEGYGESQPIASNNTSDGSDNSAEQLKNGRIEIVIQKQAI